MKDNYVKEVGERIKKLRENNNLTQKELANALGITQSALSKYEKGERLIKLQFIKRLSEYFGVTEDEIIGKKEKAYSLPTHRGYEAYHIHKNPHRI